MNIKESLDKMEKIGKVDLEVLDKLDKLRKLLKTRKTQWLEISNSDGYYFYQAVRNVELMLDTMEYRFKNSQKTNDNPKIAKDSLTLLPSIDKILNITQLSVINNELINDELIDKVLSQTQHLRNVASRTNLIESIDIDRQLIDKDQLKSKYTQLMKNIDSID